MFLVLDTNLWFVPDVAISLQKTKLNFGNTHCTKTSISVQEPITVYSHLIDFKVKLYFFLTEVWPFSSSTIKMNNIVLLTPTFISLKSLS